MTTPVSRKESSTTMSIGDVILAALVVVLGAAGTYLLLPHRHGTARPRGVHGAGAIAAGLALLVFLMFWSPPGPFLATVFFYIFGVAAIVGAFLTVTSRNPIYSALWFASVVLATSGLFLLAGPRSWPPARSSSTPARSSSRSCS